MPEQQLALVVQLVPLGLQHAPFWHAPEQQSPSAAHASGTSLQHFPLRQSRSEVQSAD